jgi:hypothetical protein
MFGTSEIAPMKWQTFLTPPCAPIAIDMADMASFAF